MPTAPLHIEVLDGLAVCRLGGELDACAAPAVREALSNVAKQSAVVVDLSGLTFIDSSGLGVLVGGVRRIRQLGGSVVLSSPTGAVARALDAAGLPRIVDVADDLEAARRLIGATARR